MASYSASGSVVDEHKEAEPEPIQGPEDRQEAEEDEEVDEDDEDSDYEDDDEDDDDSVDSDDSDDDDDEDDDDDDEEEVVEKDPDLAADRPRPQRLKLVFRNALGATSTTGYPAADTPPAPGQQPPVRIIRVVETSQSAPEPAKDKGKGKEKEALFDEAAYQKDLLAHEREKWAKERSDLLEKMKTMEQESRASFTKGEESALEYVKKLEKQLSDKHREVQQAWADALSSIDCSREQLSEKDRQIAEAGNQLTAQLTAQRLTHEQAMRATNEEHLRRETALMRAHSAEVQRLQTEVSQEQPKSSGSSSKATEPANGQQSDNAEESRAGMAAELSKVLEEKRSTEKIIADLEWSLGETKRALKKCQDAYNGEKERFLEANEVFWGANQERRTAEAAACSLRAEKVVLEVEVGRLQFAARVDRSIKGDLRAELRKWDPDFRLVGEAAATPSTSAVVKKPVVKEAAVKEAVVKVAVAKETERGGRGWTPFSGFRGRPTKAFLDPSSLAGRIWCFDFLWLLIFLYLVMAFCGNWDWQMLWGGEEVAWSRVIPLQVMGVPELLKQDPWLDLAQGMYGV